MSRQWVDFNAISPYLPRSVVGSEDAKFCSHHGIDWGALQDAIDDAEDGEARCQDRDDALDHGQSRLCKICIIIDNEA